MKRITAGLCAVVMMFAFAVFLPTRAGAVSCPECGGNMTAMDEEVMGDGNPCTSERIVYYYCNDCYASARIVEGPLGHRYEEEEVITEATCLRGGMVEHICVNCGDSYRERTPALGHDYFSRTVKAATCTDSGTVRHTCSRCKASYDETVSPLGHDYVGVLVKRPTCTEDGLMMYTCSRCNDVTYETKKALGHDYEDEVIPPTCTEGGKTIRTCAVCGDVTEEDLTKPLGHDFREVVKEASCTEDGMLVKICSRCKEFEKKVIPSPGHDFGDWETVTPATEEAAGSEHRVCSKCGSEETREIPALPKTEPEPETEAPGRGGKPARKGLIAAGGAAVLAAAAFVGIKTLKASAAAKAAAGAASAAGGGMITLKLKSVLLCLEENETNGAFEQALLKRPYLSVKKLPYAERDALGKKVGEEKPDLVITSSGSIPEAYGLSNSVRGAYDGTGLALVTENAAVDYKAMLESKALFAVSDKADSLERKIVRLILPLYKPSEEGGNWAENATLITDALGLPVLSAILNAYVVGGDIKEAKKKGMGSADLADMVNDVAGLFGLEGLSNVSEAIRVSLDQKGRLKDKKETIKGKA